MKIHEAMNMKRYMLLLLVALAAAGCSPEDDGATVPGGVDKETTINGTLKPKPNPPIKPRSATPEEHEDEIENRQNFHP